MIIDVLTLFPEILRSFLSQSLMAKALAKGLLAVNLVDIRAFASGRHRQADDRPYGGGPGMVLKPEPLAAALDSVLAGAPERPLVINLTPSGRRLDQDLVRGLSGRGRLVLICGRYEGIDQRVLDLYAGLDLSIGDYVLNGGEVPAMVLVEALARLIPGFLGHGDSCLEESHGYGLLEHPLYTRPRLWRGLAVPAALMSGDHAQVAAFRLAGAVERTRALRPDLLERPDLEDRLAAVLERPGSPLAPKVPKAPKPPRPRKSRVQAPGPPAGPAPADSDPPGPEPAGSDPPGPTPADTDRPGPGADGGPAGGEPPDS
jgi:tRNA (guanine37-N1)-methyltransferase